MNYYEVPIICPMCGSDKIEYTCIGVPKEYPDTANKATCMNCNHTGKVADFYPAEVKKLAKSNLKKLNMNSEELLLQMRINLESLKSLVTDSLLKTTVTNEIGSPAYFQGYLKALSYMLRWLDKNNVHLKK